jgi:hypothetical protein
MDDVLQICGTGDDVLQCAAGLPHGEQIGDGEVSQYVDEQFCREIEEVAGWMCICGDNSGFPWVSFILAI